jgi:hypothetical protein
MSLPSPLSRYYRDDITVSVILLGDMKERERMQDGGVFVNEEATGGGIRAIKSKLESRYHQSGGTLQKGFQSVYTYVRLHFYRCRIE